MDAGPGYVETGNWHGYAWTSSSGTGSVISPVDFSDRPLGQPFPLCASGTVAAMEDYSGTAMIGINLNQGAGANDPIGTITPTGDGITVSVTNNGSSQLRLQIQGPNGESDPNDRWCAALEGGGGTITWDKFNTKCWDDSGDTYDGQLLSAALIVVPGDNVEDIPFDFCLNSFAEEGVVVIPGSGGSSGDGGSSGSGGQSSGGSSGSGGSGGGSGNVDGGYITLGTWGKGYAWTSEPSTGSTISPEDFSDRTDLPLCSSGTLARGNDNIAMLGINLNQPKGTGTTEGTVNPRDDGLVVSLRNLGTSQLRVQLIGTGNNAWCAGVGGGTTFIPWGDFNTECWPSGNGTAYNNQPLRAVAIIAPGGPSATQPFSFCVDEIGPGRDTSTPGQGCDISGSPGSESGTFTAADYHARVPVSANRYIIQHNVWNTAVRREHEVRYLGRSFEIIRQGGSANDGSPVSFPSIFMGSNYGNTTSGHNMPRQLRALTSVPTAWSWSRNSASGQYNASYDVYFSTNNSFDSGSPSGGFLMIWLHKPSNYNPAGSDRNEIANIGGRAWDVWQGPNHEGKPVVTYIARGGSVENFSADLKHFIDDAIARRHVDQNYYLTNIMAGFEIWSGGVGLKSNNFCAQVN